MMIAAKARNCRSRRSRRGKKRARAAAAGASSRESLWIGKQKLLSPTWERSFCSWKRLVTVVIRLVRPLHRHADVRRLFHRELREPGAEFVQVESRHLLIEMLRQHVHFLF